MGRFYREILAVALVWVGASVPAHAGDDDSAVPRNQGVYAFLPSFVLDLDRRAFLNTVAMRPQSPLADCSDAEEFCLRSNEFRISFPRSCNRRNAFFESAPAIVSSFTQGRGHSPATPTYGYFDPQYPRYGFLLDGDGLVGIVYDPMARDLAAKLQPASLADTRFGQGATFTYGQLQSLAPLFACE